jgi:hypothetical protein
VRLQAVLLRQEENFGEVYIKKTGSFESVVNQGLIQAKDDWRSREILYARKVLRNKASTSKKYLK